LKQLNGDGSSFWIGIRIRIFTADQENIVIVMGPLCRL
jgi:hypothetical protein